MSKQQSKSGDGAQVPNPIQIQKFLGGLDYPATKEAILDAAEREGADDNVRQTLEQLPDREYDSPIEISREVGKLH